MFGALAAWALGSHGALSAPRAAGTTSGQLSHLDPRPAPVGVRVIIDHPKPGVTPDPWTGLRISTTTGLITPAQRFWTLMYAAVLLKIALILMAIPGLSFMSLV